MSSLSSCFRALSVADVCATMSGNAVPYPLGGSVVYRSFLAALPFSRDYVLSALFRRMSDSWQHFPSWLNTTSVRAFLLPRTSMARCFLLLTSRRLSDGGLCPLRALAPPFPAPLFFSGCVPSRRRFAPATPRRPFTSLLILWMSPPHSKSHTF